MNRIDIVLHTLNHSGVAHAAVTLANGLAKQALTPRLVVIGESTVSPYPIHNNVAVHFLGIRKNAIYIPRAILAFASYMYHEKPRNMFVWAKEFSAVSLAIRAVFSLPCRIISLHVQMISQHLKHEKNILQQLLSNVIYKRLLQLADHSIASSTDMKQELVESYGISETKISIAYPPLPEEFFAPQEIAKNTRNTPKEILFIGRLVPQKAPDRLLHIFAQLLSNIHEKPLLRLIGDGPLEEELQNIVRQKNLEDYVIFEGRQSTIIPYIRNANLLVLTSCYEGFGMVLAEAVACGTPVVSFNCPTGPSEIIQEGKNGYLIPPGNDALFIEKIQEALAKDWDSATITHTAQAFHPDIVIQDYIAVINKVFV